MKIHYIFYRLSSIVFIFWILDLDLDQILKNLKLVYSRISIYKRLKEIKKS